MTRATRSIPDPGRSTISTIFVISAGGQVVDDEPAEVLEGGRGRGATGPGHAGHHQVLAHATSLIGAARRPVRTPLVARRRADRSSGSQDRAWSSSSVAARTAFDAARAP